MLHYSYSKIYDTYYKEVRVSGTQPN
ncbi:hypothetical protein IM043_gp153 [Bacillus phage SPG24]|nr:hypothetical protein IM043_gp153 [Bacillus phage SPG24]